MKPRSIILIRHGQSEGNVDRSQYDRVPDWQIKLTDKGREQALQAGDDIGANWQGPPYSAVRTYTSSYIRARDTAVTVHQGLFGGVVGEIREDPRLREQEWGAPHINMGNRPQIEAERDAYGTFYYRFKHGESGADVYDRCTTFLDTLYRDFEKADFPSHCLIVSHAFTLRVLLMRWLHWSVDTFHAARKPGNAEWFELALGNNGHYRLTEPYPTKIVEQSLAP